MSVMNTGATTMASFSSQCFPVRSLTGGYKKEDEGGAWLVAYRAEQRRRFKAVLCGSGDQVPIQPSPRKSKSAIAETDITEQDKPRKLDGFYLMKQFYVDDPADLCYIRISGRDLREVSETDFLMFDNVVHVDAGDNNLPFNAFRMFQALCELELPLNNISGSIRIDPSRDFHHLETLDLSYNRLTGEDILALGLLQNLKTLHLTGNEIKKLPVEMGRTYRTITGITPSGSVESQDRRVRFPLLENLYLDQNYLTDLSTFASLAGLKRLRYLNLEHNEITSVPHLRLLGARVRHNHEKTKTTEDNKQYETQSVQQHKEDQSTSQGSSKQSTGGEDETGVALADEVEEMLSRKLPEVEEGDEDIEKPDLLHPRSSTLTEDPALLDEKYDPPLPFSSLLHLNMANNLVFEEEGLLALSSWPVLKELVIWGNPLTTAFKGDPPILSFQLGQLKGVRIFRQKPKITRSPKPVMNLADNTRKVSDALPPVPRKRDLFMLEASPKHESIAFVGPHAQPLPPIASAPPRHRPQPAVPPRQLVTAPATTEALWNNSSCTRHHPREKSHDRTSHSLSPDVMTIGSLQTEGETTRAEAVDKAGIRPPQAWADEPKQESEDGFFMTQIDELENAEQTSKTKQEPQKCKLQTNKRKEDDRPFSVQTKYKGFEDLLDVDESDQDIVIPKDIQGSVRALHYALRHPLVFTEEPQGFTYKEKTTRKPRDAFHAGSRQKSQQSKVEEMGDILDKMRVKSKTTESNLETVLKNYKKDPSFRKEYQEAKKLLSEVQAKYNEVRVSSLKPTAEAYMLFGNNTNETGPEESVDGTTKSLPKRKISDRTLIQNDSKHVVMDLKKFKEKIDSRI